MRFMLLATIALLTGVHGAQAQQAGGAPAAEAPFAAGEPLGVTTEGERTSISDNVSVYGSFVFAESCSYDSTRDLIVVVNRGASQAQVPNDGFVSLINHEGMVHTAKWIGATRDGLILNDPLGSVIAGERLYVADRDGGTAENEPTTAVIRVFDLATGAPSGEMPIEGSPWVNDLAVAEDGTIYATQTGAGGDNPNPASWRLYEVSPDGVVSVLVEGEPLFRPNGVAIDNDGNIVVVNMGNSGVLTFSPEGELLNTQNAVQAGTDGLVIMPDGTKYTSSVQFGVVSRIPAEGEAEMIASGIPSAASMCYDEGGNQLVIPMNPNNAIALISLDG